MANIPIKIKPIQLTLNFNENTNQPWWSGIVCKPQHYFDLLKQNFNIEDLMIPWEIEDYQKTKQISIWNN